MRIILRHLIHPIFVGVGFILLVSLPAVAQTDNAHSASREFSCTQVLGFSQSLEWYGGLSLSDFMAGESPPDLDPGTFLPGWQGAFYMGASIEKWLDPGFPAWTDNDITTHGATAHCRREQVDRVIFNVSGPERSVKEWANAVESVARRIRKAFPAVRKIVMQPAVGAPDCQCHDVLAARNHSDIARGIRLAAKRNGITAGPEPKLEDCSHYRDPLGHLTKDGAKHVHGRLKAHYRAALGESVEG